MILVTVNTLAYTDTEMYGPFSSVEEAKQNITNGVEQGYDGDDTKYTFFEVSESGTKEVGFIRFYEVRRKNRLDTEREEYFSKV